MPNTLPLTSLLVVAALVAAAPALAADGWDHRAMQSHHQAIDRVERPLAPGEKRIGRIEIGAVSASPAQVPETLPNATQRQWEQAHSFPSPILLPAGSAPRVTGGRHDDSPKGHATPSR